MNNMPDTSATLLPAWEDPVHGAQACFRAVLRAMSEPGSVVDLSASTSISLAAPAPLQLASTALCLTLLDYDTPLWLDAAARAPAVLDYLRFHCSVPVVQQQDNAQFALLAEPAALQLLEFAQGDPAYPDRSATLWLQVPSLQDGPALVMRGPGIPGERRFAVAGLPADFFSQWQRNAAQFPLGLDIVFCCGSQLLGLPRSTQLTAP
jgi:alpha-D-ribose 1-methylphosphonate 5-triphosphate synthase subunit PhnH